MNPLFGNFVDLPVRSCRDDDNQHFTLNFFQFVDNTKTTREQFYFEESGKAPGERVTVSALTGCLRILSNVLDFFKDFPRNGRVKLLQVA